MKLRTVLVLLFALIWLFVVIWFLMDKRSAALTSQSRFQSQSKIFDVVSRDGVSLGEFVDLYSVIDGDSENARVIEIIRGLMVKSLADDHVGGLNIQTTIDSGLQQVALDLVAKASAAGDLGLVVLDNHTGAILAVIGGRLPADLSVDTNLAVDRKFQVGAMFAPFIYSVAVDRGGLDLSAEIEVGGKKVSLKEAFLALDQDTTSVVAEMAGKQGLNGLLQALQFDRTGQLDLDAIAKGDFESTLMTLTSAYSTIAAEGENYSPYMLEKIENYDRKVLFANNPRSTTVFISNIPRSVVKLIDEKNNLRMVSAGNWCVGFNDKITIGLYAVDGDDAAEKLRAICEEIAKVADQRGLGKVEAK